MAIANAMEVGLDMCIEYLLECKSTTWQIWDVEEEARDNGEVTCTTYSSRTLSRKEC